MHVLVPNVAYKVGMDPAFLCTKLVYEKQVRNCRSYWDVKKGPVFLLDRLHELTGCDHIRNKTCLTRCSLGGGRSLAFRLIIKGFLQSIYVISRGEVRFFFIDNLHGPELSGA
jgi:hypothetical protein